MSMFRRPTDDDSSSDSESDESEEESIHAHSKGSTEEVTGADLTATETLSSGESMSFGDSRDDTGITNVEHHRNMMLASLLEEFYRTRAAELLNAANPGSNFHRQSPEVQPFARDLFNQASQPLAAGGVLPKVTVSEDSQASRNQYIAGFENLGLQNIPDTELLSQSMRQRLSVANGNSLALIKNYARPVTMTTNQLEAPIRDLTFRQTSMNLISLPTNDMQLMSIQQPRSHYQSSFQEMRLIGKGGFGRVYHTFNVFDKKDYAIKKIPLSPRLSQKYREKGHAELTGILREVQALARLDHCNVVRYHATWIEEPSMVKPPAVPEPKFSRPLYRQRMLTDKPAYSAEDNVGPKQHVTPPSHDISNGVMFAADSTDVIHNHRVDRGWSFGSESHHADQSSALNSDIFTDGLGRDVSHTKVADDPYCYVLHVQMSLYPMTLAQYLTPAQVNSSSNPNAPAERHCFHLVPALRILLGILCGLQYIHNQGLVHRDIKPGNVFISGYDVLNSIVLPEGYQDVGSCPSCPDRQPCYVNPRIGDFGLVMELAHNAADIRNGSSSSSDKLVGTEYYHPPKVEKDKGKSSHLVDEKLDVFALGVILVEMLSRCTTSMERLDLLKGLQESRLPSGFIEGVDREGHDVGLGHIVAECVLGMINKNPHERWTSSMVKEHVESILRRCRSWNSHFR